MVLPAREAIMMDANEGRYKPRGIGRRSEDWAVRDQNNRHLMLFHVGQIITSETNLDLLFEVIMDETNKIMGAERSTVFLHDDKSGDLWSLVATGMKRNEIRILDTYGVAGWCFQRRTHLVINDAYDDPRFYKEIDRKSGFRTRNILCIPLINRHSQRIGALQTLNKISGDFTNDDLLLLKSMSYYVTIALENAKLIEEMRKKEIALRESEEKYRTILESIEDGYYEVDIGGSLVFFNESMSRILGYPPAEMTGMNNRVFMSPDTAKKVFQTFNEVFRTGKPTKAFGWELKRKDGDIRYVETSVSAVRDSMGETVGFRGIARDITELKSLDKARERVISHLSHEMRTPLSIVGGVLERVERKASGEAVQDIENLILRGNRNVKRLLDMQEKIDDIVGGRSPEEKYKTLHLIEGALSLVEEAKDDSRDQCTRDFIDRVAGRLEALYTMPELKSQKIELKHFLDGICSEAIDAMKDRSMTIERDFASDLWLKIDPVLLKKLCEGLLRNAIQNTPDEGAVILRAYSQDNSTQIEFKDHGVGISRENQKMVFGGFFHTQDSSLYSTKKHYQFGAGGSGADLLRMKVLSERLRFSIAFQSSRCKFLPEDTNICPGRISSCGRIVERSECFSSGGSTFTLGFPLSRF
jgi:PAS domain S-box-containing protein